MAEIPVRQNPIDARPWTFYALGTLFAAYLLFLYGPMLVIYALSFQGPNGGVTFPIVEPSLEWFRDVWRPGQMANIPDGLEAAAVLSDQVFRERPVSTGDHVTLSWPEASAHRLAA
jgi:hypothetical protein